MFVFTRVTAVSYNGLLVAVGYSNGAWECLDFETLERLPSVQSAHSNNMDKSAGGGPFLRRRTDKESKKTIAEAVSDIKFSPDSSMVAVAGHDNFIDIWSTSYYGERLGVLHLCRWEVSAEFIFVCFSAVLRPK